MSCNNLSAHLSAVCPHSLTHSRLSLPRTQTLMSRRHKNKQKQKEGSAVSEQQQIFDYDRMKEICLAPIEAFAAVGTQHIGSLGRHFYRDNGSNVLAIAHLDTVQSTQHFN